MARDDEQSEFAWPAHDADGHTDDGGTDSVTEDSAADERAEGGKDEAGEADAGTATTELPVRDVPKPSGAGRPANAEQPTVWAAVPRRSGHPPAGRQPHAAAPPASEQASTQPLAVRPAGSQRAEPERVGPEGAGPEKAGQPGEPATTQPPRKRRRWPVAVVAVLVVVAVAVVLALPPVSNRLALPWAPNAPKGEPPEPAAISRTLHGPRTGPEHRPSPAGVGAALRDAASNPALGTLAGSVVDPSTGRTLWSRNAGKPRIPASTTKLLTSSAALLALGPGMRIPTTVVAGREPGTVVLVAGGDVTLSSLPKGESSIYPDAAHLDQLVAEVKRATDGNVDKVAIDLTAYTGKPTAPGWDPGDVRKYTAAAVPGMLDGGRKDPRANHSDRVADPAGALLDEFANRLGADVAGRSTVRAPQDARVLGRVHSAPLTTLVRRCLELSDNVLADALARQVAMATGKEPSFTGATKAVRQVLSRNGFDVRGLRLFDGSGLSDRNRVPPRLLASILSAAAAPADGADPRTATLRPILAGLPVAGGTGTLAERYDQAPSDAGRGWVRAKTGTLSDVNALAGTVLDSDGHVLVFVFMSAGTPAPEARPALDALAAELRGCGCAAA